MTSKQYRWTLLAICLLAFLARILFLFIFSLYGQINNSDAAEYSQIAHNLLAGYGFAFGPGEPTAFRPYGYPFFLAFVYLLGNVGLVHWLQAIAGSLIILPAYAIARRFFGAAAAIWSAIGIALHPVLIYLTALLAPEVLAILAQMMLLWLAMEIIIDNVRHRQLRALGYVLIGTTAIWLRPELLLVVWFLPAAAWLSRKAGTRSIYNLLVVTLLATILALVLPLIRNQLVMQTPSPMPTIGGVTFWGANNAAANGGWLAPTAEIWPDNDPPLSMRGWPGLTETESQNQFYAASWQWIKANPSTALALIPKKLARSWTLSYADESKTSDLPSWANIANSLMGISVIIGLVIAWREYRLAFWLLLAPLAAWLAKTIIFYGSARQTAVALPIFLILAGLTMQRLLQLLPLHHFVLDSFTRIRSPHNPISL